MDCIVEGHVGPVSEETRPRGAHPSPGAVGRASQYARLPGGWGRKAEASVAATPVSWDMWPVTQSLTHPFIDVY